MSDQNALYLIAILFCILLLPGIGYVLGYTPEDRSKKLTSRMYLPGPQRNIFGDNTGQFSAVAPFSAFQGWARKYGAIFQVKLGSQHMISVNDPVLAKELFEKRGGMYSSRVVPHVSFDILSQQRRIAFAPSGRMHRVFRKQMQTILSITRTPENQKHQELESRQTLQDILDISVANASQNFTGDYSNIQSALRRYTASVMTTLAFGHRVPDFKDSDFIKTIFEIMGDNAAAIQPGRYYADVYPILRRLPYFLRTWQHEAERKVRWQWLFLRRLLHQVESQRNLGIANPGLVRALIDQRATMLPDKQAEDFVDDKSIAYQALTIVEAGSDTTAIALMNFTCAMALHPDIMKKGQAAVDAAVSDLRLPTYDDIPQLQYARQLMKETLRWRPPITMGIAHANKEDDEINGYYIPKESAIVGNIWAMHQDPQHYFNPERFDPSRYENSTKTAFESSTEPDAMDRDHYAFGWGRRICPGLHLAENSLLLLITRLLWAFDIVRESDTAGNLLPLTADPLKDYENSSLMNPKVFPVAFRLRNEKRGAVIHESHQDAVRLWNELNLDISRF